jgi:hypothetical protein
MSLVRFAALLILTVWIGGLVGLGWIAAPTLFSVLTAHDPVNGPTTAAMAFGAIFTRFQYVAWGLGGLFLALLAGRAVIGPRPRRFGIRMWTAAVMLATSLATGLVLAPRIEAIRADVTDIGALPATDARRVEFGRLHGLSNALMLLTVLAGTWLIWAESRDTH